MNRRIGPRPDKRVSIALSLLAAVLALLGAHQMPLRGTGSAPGQPVQMASAMVSSQAR